MMMTRGQMHVFNWFFLLIMAAILGLHVIVSRSLLAAGKITKGLEPSLFVVVAVFALIWLALYIIQMKAFETKKGRVCIVLNGILAGIWIMVYTFLNFS